MVEIIVMRRDTRGVWRPERQVIWKWAQGSADDLAHQSGTKHGEGHGECTAERGSRRHEIGAEANVGLRTARHWVKARSAHTLIRRNKVWTGEPVEERIIYRYHKPI